MWKEERCYSGYYVESLHSHVDPCICDVSRGDGDKDVYIT
jgi:hypothetical protein